jgi:hypothetical protein
VAPFAVAVLDVVVDEAEVMAELDRRSTWRLYTSDAADD